MTTDTLCEALAASLSGLMDESDHIRILLRDAGVALDVLSPQAPARQLWLEGVRQAESTPGHFGLLLAEIQQTLPGWVEQLELPLLLELLKKGAPLFLSPRMILRVQRHVESLLSAGGFAQEPSLREASAWGLWLGTNLPKATLEALAEALRHVWSMDVTLSEWKQEIFSNGIEILALGGHDMHSPELQSLALVGLLRHPCPPWLAEAVLSRALSTNGSPIRPLAALIWAGLIQRSFQCQGRNVEALLQVGQAAWHAYLDEWRVNEGADAAADDAWRPPRPVVQSVLGGPESTSVVRIQLPQSTRSPLDGRFAPPRPIPGFLELSLTSLDSDVLYFTWTTGMGLRIPKFLTPLI